MKRVSGLGERGGQGRGIGWLGIRRCRRGGGGACWDCDCKESFKCK